MVSKTRLKYLRSLKLKKFRKQEGKFLIEGVRFCEEAVASKFEVESIYYEPSLLASGRGKQLVEACKQNGLETDEISSNDLQKIANTVHAQGIVGVMKAKTFTWNEMEFENTATLLALAQISDPGNLGTIIRTADWFGVSAVLLSQGSVELYNPKVLRATMGSIFHLPISEELNLAEALIEAKRMGFVTYSADVRGRYIYNQVGFAPRRVLVLGGETSGIDTELLNVCEYALRIPGQGKAESLNVAVAAGIVLSEMHRL